MTKPELTMRKTSMGVVICYNRRPTLENCMKRAKAASDSYAAELVEVIYEWYLGNALDLRAEYAKYYRAEYESLETFLFFKQGCSLRDIRAMRRDLDSNRRVALVLDSVDWEGRIENFLYEEGGDAIAARVLGARWVGAK